MEEVFSLLVISFGLPVSHGFNAMGAKGKSQKHTVFQTILNSENLQ